MDPPPAAPRSPDRLDCAIVTFYYPPSLGGLEAYLERLAAALGRRIQVAVLAPRVAGCETWDAASPVRVLRRPLLGRVIFRWEFLFKPLYPLVAAGFFFWTIASLGRLRPRVVCSGSADFALPIALAARLIGARFALICHGKDGHVRPGIFARVFKRWPLAAAMRAADVCFANSRFTAGLLDPDGRFGAKIELLPVPIEKAEVDEASIERARAIVAGEGSGGDAPEPGPVILSVGRLRRHKGFQHVIAALALLGEEFPTARYVIVGGGPFEGELRREAERSGVAGRVIFAGVRRPADPFFALADVFATVTWGVPDEPEGFGMVFIEAGAHGVPSVAGNIGGMTEAVKDGETGLTVEPADPEAIAGALRRLLGDEALRRRMGEAARHYAREFEPGRVAEIFMRECGLHARRGK